MKEQFCSYEISLKLKELGFDEGCLAKYCRYNPNDEIEIFSQTQNFFKGYFEVCFNRDYKKEEKIAAPLWQQAIDWFRKEYDLHIVLTVNPYSERDTVNGYKIYDGKKELRCIVNNETQSLDYYYSREQAILKAIELCQKEK